MAQTVNCAFARAAVKELYTKYSPPHRKLPLPAFANVHKDFVELFPNFQIDYALAKKRFPNVNKVFNKRWHPDNAKKLYLQTFKTSNWEALSPSEKQQHTMRECKACANFQGSVYNLFPTGRKINKENEITLTIPKNTTPKEAGKYVIKTLGPFVETQTGTSLQNALVETPRSKLMLKPSGNKRLDDKRRAERQFRNRIEAEFEQADSSFIMANRVSWSTYDRLRKYESLQPTSKRKADEGIESTPKRRKRGDITDIDTVRLLEEARAWPSDKVINWTELARRHGLVQRNGGQILKEFLATNEIQVAKRNERQTRAPQRAKKRSSNGTFFPMHAPASKHKQTIKDQIAKGDILLGDSIAKTDINSYRVTNDTHSIEKITSTHYARHIKLSDIREKMTKDHQKLGLIRDNSDQYIDGLKDEEVTRKLDTLNLTTNGSISDQKNLLKIASRSRSLKIWHDHSQIGGHGHLLVLVSAIYDPALFFTPRELAEKGMSIDVESLVERPYIHILGRSRSSLEDQARFHEYRLNCIKEVNSPITIGTHTIHDTIRVFHGDGPAQQVEAGSKIGGNYPCIGCTASADRFSDLAFCYRADTMSIKQRQQFVVTGSAWRKGGTKPLDGLTAEELRTELKAHDLPVKGKNKKQLVADFDNIRKGINTVPALLQSDPKQSLININLEKYEIFPNEPLHDLKGHLSNLIEETLATETGEIKEAIQEVSDTVLCKETLRCSDYRKAIILMYKYLVDKKCDEIVTEIYRTAVEMSEILYAHEENRNTTSILRLHNVSFIHGVLCVQKFGLPKSMTSRKFFGRYFHSLTCHAALTYRQISLRSINTETQERMFQACKSITRSTSNKHPDHIITNIIQRLSAEQDEKLSQESIVRQESEISKLNSTLPAKCNTTLRKAWIRKHSTHYQAHLERISDYLIHGKGIWWDETGNEIVFYDTSQKTIPTGPKLMHFRNTNEHNIRINLFQEWETCFEMNVILPAQTIRQYTSEGTLHSIINT